MPRFADLGASQSYAAFLSSVGIGGVAAFLEESTEERCRTARCNPSPRNWSK